MGSGLPRRNQGEYDLKSLKGPKVSNGACSNVPCSFYGPVFPANFYVNSNIPGKSIFQKTKAKPHTSSTVASAEVNAIETENETERASAYPSVHGPGHPTGPVQVAILS